MKNNNIKKILFVILTVLIAIIIYKINNKKNNFDQFYFSIKDTASITTIKILCDNDSVLIKRTGNYWNINEKYIADNEKITEALSSLRKFTVKATVPPNAEQNIRRKLKKSLKIYIFSNKKILKGYFIENAVLPDNAFYMMTDEKPFIVYIPGSQRSITNIFSCKTNDWRNKNIFGYLSGDIKKVRLKSKTNYYEITVSTDDITLISGKIKFAKEKINTEAVLFYLSQFYNCRFEKYTDKNIELSDNDLVYELEITTELNNKKIKIYSINKNGKTDPDFAFVVLDDGTIVLAKYYNLDAIIKNVNYFLK